LRSAAGTRLPRLALWLAPMLLGCGSLAAAAETAAQPADPAAQAPEAADPPPPADATEPDKWKFATIGYLWAAGAHGETDVIGPAEPVGLDLSFGDVLDAFKFAFMGAAEARHGRVVILGDLTFIHLGVKKGIDIREQDFADAKLDSLTSEVTLVGGYRVADQGPVFVDLMAGGRLNWFKTTLELEGPNRSAEGEVKETWIDPLIAARVVAPLGGKWSSTVYGDVGGIVAGSDITWQIFGTVNYRIKPKMQLGAGWRAFKVHYDEGVFLYDVAQNGPVFVFRTEF